MNISTQTNTVANPLETLVIQQLAHLIQDERTLATKYPVLNAGSDNPEERAAFFDGLYELRRRAERLQRYVDALDIYGLATAAC